jgi:hypothetical protein
MFNIAEEKVIDTGMFSLDNGIVKVLREIANAT